MSIRSVDMMILYSKTSDVEKMQQAEQQQGRVSQQQIATDEVKDKEIKQSQVQNAKKDDESGRISEQPERKQGRRMASGEDNSEEDQDNKENEQGGGKDEFGKPPHTGMIDIRV